MAIHSDHLVILGLDHPAPYQSKPGKNWPWGPLRVYSYYRLFLASLILFLFQFSSARSVLGSLDADLFYQIALLHLSLCCVGVVTTSRCHPSYHSQVATIVAIDILALGAMTYASGGLISGLGLLILVSVASGSILLNSLAFPFAALATLVLLTIMMFLQLHPSQVAVAYSQAGLMGMALFICAFLVRSLSQRVLASEAIAQQRGEFIAEMQRLNAHIVQRFDAGIVVTQANGKISLMNEVAWHLLGNPRRSEAPELGRLSQSLYVAYSAWRRHPESEAKDITLTPSGLAVRPKFSALGDPKTEPVLILLEDSSRLKQQAQKMKLASLGGLTAGIAHEIRNPLGAISHAAQLLSEADPDNAQQNRLVQIIVKHTQRVNQIIENVMNLSKQGHIKPEVIELHHALIALMGDLKQAHPDKSYQITTKIQPLDTRIEFDLVQLHQVLTNLCENALYHASKDPHQDGVILNLMGGTSVEFKEPILDVIDNGPGINPDQLERIFEPFYSTNHKGMGLGLYMAQQLCEANQARLEYIALARGGSCFRIHFKAAKVTGGTS